MRRGIVYPAIVGEFDGLFNYHCNTLFFVSLHQQSTLSYASALWTLPASEFRPLPAYRMLQMSVDELSQRMGVKHGIEVILVNVLVDLLKYRHYLSQP